MSCSSLHLLLQVSSVQAQADQSTARASQLQSENSVLSSRLTTALAEGEAGARRRGEELQQLRDQVKESRGEKVLLSLPPHAPFVNR